MVARTNELTKKLKEKQVGVLDDISKAVKGATNNSPEAQLKAAAEKHKTGDVIIQRKNKNSRWGYFYTLEGMGLSEINPNDFEGLCAREGGGGEYMVKVKLPTGDPLKFGPYDVIGRPLAEPKSVTDAQGIGQSAIPPELRSLGFMQPGMGSKVGKGAAGDESTAEAQKQMFSMMNKYQEELAEQQAKSGDRQMSMMMMMQQQQQASSNQLMQVLATALAPQRAEPAAVSSRDQELRSMREELQRLREKESQAQIESLKQQIQDNKLEALKLAQPKSDGTDKIFGHLLAAQQASSAENSKLMFKAMEMSADRPSHSDQISSILSSVIGATSTNLDLLSKAAQNGLLGGTDSPIKDAFIRSMESATEVLPGLLQGLVAGRMPQAAQQYEQYEEVEQPEVQQMPAPEPEPAALAEAPSQGITVEEVGPMSGTHSPPSIPPAPPAAVVQPPAQPQYTEEQVAELARRMYSDEEMAALLKDQAMTTIVAKIQNSVSAREISARIWVHAESPNKLAAQWWMDPEVISQQVVLGLQVGDQARAIEVAQDLVNFRAYLTTPGADPNSWPDTDYRPVKAPRKPVTVAAEDGEPVEEAVESETTPTPEQGEAITSEPPMEVINEGVTVSEIPDAPDPVVGNE